MPQKAMRNVKKTETIKINKLENAKKESKSQYKSKKAPTKTKKRKRQNSKELGLKKKKLKKTQNQIIFKKKQFTVFLNIIVLYLFDIKEEERKEKESKLKKKCSELCDFFLLCNKHIKDPILRNVFVYLTNRLKSKAIFIYNNIQNYNLKMIEKEIIIQIVTNGSIKKVYKPSNVKTLIKLVKDEFLIEFKHIIKKLDPELILNYENKFYNFKKI